MLITVVAVSGYATISKDLTIGSLRLGSINAQGLVSGEGGQIGDISLGRMGTIIKPVTVPTSAQSSHVPIVYLANGNEGVGSIAAKFGISVSDVQWSNTWLSGDTVKKGKRLLIPPVDGVVVVAKKGDTAEGVASYFHVDLASIIDFNYLRDTKLTPGLALVVPKGKGPDLSPPPSDGSATPTFIAPSNYSSGGYAPSNRVTSRGRVGGYSANRFTYGYCTWYVATRRSIPWIGDAWQWYGNAISYGFAVGKKPRVGAIMDTWESSFGHVAYVEAVYPDGSWRVSEMNFVGWGVVSGRTIHPGEVPLIGFIY